MGTPSSSHLGLFPSLTIFLQIINLLWNISHQKQYIPASTMLFLTTCFEPLALAAALASALFYLRDMRAICKAVSEVKLGALPISV